MSIELITTETPKPVMRVAGIVMYTGGEITKRVKPAIKIDKPIQLDFERPKRWAIRGFAQPAKMEAIPIAVPCKPAIVREVP